MSRAAARTWLSLSRLADLELDAHARQFALLNYYPSLAAPDALFVRLNRAAADRNLAQAELAVTIGFHAGVKNVTVTGVDLDFHNGSFYWVTCRIQHFTGNGTGRMMSGGLGIIGRYGEEDHGQYQE